MWKQANGIEREKNASNNICILLSSAKWMTTTTTTKKPYRNESNEKTTTTTITLKSQAIYLDKFLFISKSHIFLFVLSLSACCCLYLDGMPFKLEIIRKFKYIHGFMWAVKHPSFRNEIELLLPSNEIFYRRIHHKKPHHHHFDRTAERKKL